MRFEWDEDKAAANIKEHEGVTFDEACEVFDDPNAIDEYDAEHSDNEDRYNIIGLSSRRLLFVVYTERENAIRIISARKAEEKEEALYGES